ncbi:MAG: type 2 lantipeptide synthetase LanM, partial [Sphingomonadales bacterium]
TAGPAIESLSPYARTILCRTLLIRLSDIALATFASEFALHRALRPALPGLPASADTGYRAFVAAGSGETLRHYPILAALLEQACDDWAESHGEMLARLHADWPEIRRVFGARDPVLAGLAPSCSDPHHGGRAVTCLGFVDGLALVYKPRSVAMEQGLGSLLGWANAQGYSRPFYRPALIERRGYGWMTHVAAAPCRTAADIHAYYHRIGGLLALVTLFQGTDIHRENLIAAGEHPVIVDAETLLHPRLDPEYARTLGPGAMRAAASGDFAQALDECGFIARAGEPDFSALGTAGSVETPFPHPRCIGVNSDAMRIEQVPYRAPPRNHVPMLDGQPHYATEQVEPILAGYAELLAIAIRDRAGLLDLARSFAGRPTRLIIRSTNAYGLLLNASLEPAMLRSASARVALFGRLGAADSDIADAEQRALLRLDVPHVTCPCDEPGPGWAAPLAQVEQRIAGLRDQDIALHLALLRARIAAAATLEPTATGDRS